MLSQSESIKHKGACIGIDVVAWPVSSRHQLTPRWLEKIFGPEETTVILNQPSALQTAWYSWAAKEATFKALSGYHDSLTFIPRRIQLSYQEGIPITATDLSTHITLSLHCTAIGRDLAQGLQGIQAVALQPSSRVEKVCCGIRSTLPPHQPTLASTLLYQDLIPHIAQALEVSVEQVDLRARRRNRPILMVGGTPISFPFSVSHHRNLGVWAFLTDS